jgi:hypothetical protein
VAAKRQKINRNSAVITHEMYLAAVAEVEGKKSKVVPAKRNPPVVIQSSSGAHNISTSSEKGADEPPLPIKEGDFVVLRLEPKGRKKFSAVYYVGHVVCSSGQKMWRINCMRRHGDSYNEYIFPDAPDSDIYFTDEIVHILSSPKLSRSVHIFPDNLSVYHSGLR